MSTGLESFKVLLSKRLHRVSGWPLITTPEGPIELTNARFGAGVVYASLAIPSGGGLLGEHTKYL